MCISKNKYIATGTLEMIKPFVFSFFSIWIWWSARYEIYMDDRGAGLPVMLRDSISLYNPFENIRAL